MRRPGLKICFTRRDAATPCMPTSSLTGPSAPRTLACSTPPRRPLRVWFYLSANAPEMHELRWKPSTTTATRTSSS